MSKFTQASSPAVPRPMRPVTSPPHYADESRNCARCPKPCLRLLEIRRFGPASMAGDARNARSRSGIRHCGVKLRVEFQRQSHHRSRGRLGHLVVRNEIKLLERQTFLADVTELAAHTQVVGKTFHGADDK